MSFERVAAGASRGNDQLKLSRQGSDQQVEFVDARGVCLLRSGKIQEAILLYRGLVLKSGSTSCRDDLPAAVLVNFATALLMGGHPGGCLEVLHELKDGLPPSAFELLAAVKTWEKTLSWLEWLDWKVNRVEPRPRPIAVDFLPGLFTSDAGTASPR